MKRSILFLLLIVMAFVVGCGNPTIVRDENTYKIEVELMAQMSMQSAASMREFVKSDCSCKNGKFSTKNCADAADLILVIESRLPWHKAMSFYNAGITDERPSKTPPVIPPTKTLCP